MVILNFICDATRAYHEFTFFFLIVLFSSMNYQIFLWSHNITPLDIKFSVEAYQMCISFKFYVLSFVFVFIYLVFFQILFYILSFCSSFGFSFCFCVLFVNVICLSLIFLCLHYCVSISTLFHIFSVVLGPVLYVT